MDLCGAHARLARLACAVMTTETADTIKSSTYN